MAYVNLWIALGTAVAASAVSYENTQQTQHKQDNQLATSLRQQGQLQQSENAKANQLIQKSAVSNPDQIKKSLLGQFAAQIANNGDNSTTNLHQAGKVSSSYAKAASDAQAGISKYGADQSGLQADMQAPALQRQNEAANLSQFSSDLTGTRMQSAGEEYINNLRLKAIQPNPWMSGLSQGLGAFSQAYAAKGASGAGGGGTALNTKVGAGSAANGAFGGAVGNAPASGFGSLYNF